MYRKSGIFVALVAVAGGIGATWFFLWDGSHDQNADAVTPIETPVPAAVHMTLEELRQFDDFPVFWLGEEYQGLPLTDITHYRESGSPGVGVPPQEDIAVTYGTCTPPEPPLEGGCLPPIVVFTERPCAEPVSLLADEAKEGPARIMRGATVQMVFSGNVLVYFGQTTVNIASTKREFGLAAVNALRGANDAGLTMAPDTASPLGSPVPEAECDFPPPTWLASPLKTAIAEEAPQWIKDTFLPDEGEEAPSATLTATPTAATSRPGDNE